MTNSLLKVGGVTDKKTALPISLSDAGHLRTNQFPSTSFYLGKLNEPTADGHIGAYGIFGLEVLRTDYKGEVFHNRYQSAVLAKKGRYYFVSVVSGVGTMTPYVTMVDTVSQERKTVVESSYNPSTGGSSYPLTIIDLGSNIAVVNQIGVGTIYNASSLDKVGDVAWDQTAYVRGGVQLASSALSHPNIQYRDSNSAVTSVLSAHRISQYNVDGTLASYVDIETIIGETGAYLQSIRHFDANSKYFFITASLAGTANNNGLAIIIVKRSDFSLVKIVKSSAEIPRTLVPVAFASSSDEKFYTVEVSTGDIYSWTITGSVVVFDEASIGSFGFTNNISSIFAIRKDGITLMRTVNGVYLYNFDENKLMWSLDIPTIGQNGTAHFDGFGHVMFGDSDNNLLLVSQYLQLQGYGVNA